ncbi:MAG: hypothetical protein R6T96_13465 [Longimicrobiales bacterium]
MSEKESRAWGPPIPGWVPPVLYGVVTLFLFRKFIFSGDMLYGSDTISLGYMARAFFAEAMKGGVFPFWNPIILGGTPFLDSLAGGDTLYPTSLLLLVMEPFRALGWKLVIHVFLAGLFTFGWIRALGRSPTAALLTGLAYLLAPFMVTLIWPGHDGKLFVTALTPLLFWAAESALARGRILPFTGMAAVIGLIIFTTHFQQAYFLFGALGIYALVRVILLWREGLSPLRAGSRFGLFLAFSVLGAAVAGVQLLPAVDYVMEASRRTATTTRATEEGSVAYSSSWSMHPEEAAAMLVPEFVGSDVGGAAWVEGTYWGRNIFKLNHEYAGLVVLLLAGLAFFGGAAPGVRYTFLGIGGVALLYTLGTHTPIWRIFYEVVPGISLFRAPSIAAFLFGFSAVTLMAFGIDRVLELAGAGSEEGDHRAGKKATPGKDGASRKEDQDRPVLLFLSVATGLFLLGAFLASSGILTSAWTSLLYSDIGSGKLDALARAQPFITRGFLISAGLAGGVLALTGAVLRRKVPVLVWVMGLGFLVTADLVRVNDPFIQTYDFRQWATPDPNIQYLLERQETEPPFRVMAMAGNAGFGQDVKPGMYGLELATGHHPNDLARYRELIGMVGSGAPANLIDLRTGAPNLDLLSILNVRYIIWPVADLGALPTGEAVMATSLDGRNAYEAVYEVPTLPRARLVGSARVMPGQEGLKYLLSSEFRSEAEVVLPEAPPISLPEAPATGQVRWLEKGINRLRLSVETEEPALLVLAENWYPAWKATVSGEEAPVLRANHTQRAIPILPGSHEVDVYFDVGSLKAGFLATVISVLLLMGLAVWGRMSRP